MSQFSVRYMSRLTLSILLLLAWISAPAQQTSIVAPGATSDPGSGGTTSTPNNNSSTSVINPGTETQTGEAPVTGQGVRANLSPGSPGTTTLPGTTTTPVVVNPLGVKDPATLTPVTVPTADSNDKGSNIVPLAIGGVCLAAIAGFAMMGAKSGSDKNLKNIEDLNDVMGRLRAQGGYSYEDYERETAAEIGMDASARLNANCNNFMSKDGQLGVLGKDILQQVKAQPEAFADNKPTDIIRKICPGYNRMDTKKRELFWVWVFGSLASAESSCNPQAINRKCNRQDARRTGCKFNKNSPPNGNAIGLFQLEPRRCNGISQKALLDPHRNAQCAVRVLAGELTSRNTLLDYRQETYWGPFRGNTKHKGDKGANKRVTSLIGQFRYCSQGLGQ